MLKVMFGSITNEKEEFLINDMCIIVDKETGVLLKYGDKEKSDIIKYYETMCDSLAKIGLDNTYDLITFDRYKGNLSIDDICTIVNYGLNAHSERFLNIFTLSEEDLHKRINELKKYGY